MHAIQTDRDPGGMEVVTVAATAIGFTASKLIPSSGIYKGMIAQEVFCTLETAPIRYTVDGTTPTTAIGHLVNIGDTLELYNPNMVNKFRAIRTTGTNGSLKCTFMF